MLDSYPPMAQNRALDLSGCTVLIGEQFHSSFGLSQLSCMEEPNARLTWLKLEFSSMGFTDEGTGICFLGALVAGILRAIVTRPGLRPGRYRRNSNPFDCIPVILMLN